MTDRFFDNLMPDLSQSVAEEGDSLMNLLGMPYSFLSQNLQRSALGLKETVHAKDIVFFFSFFLILLL